MDDHLVASASNLTTPYTPVALYFEGSDTLEYVREDLPTVYRRVDGFLTLIFDMQSREKLVGFQLKGFKNFYLQEGVREKLGDFVTLVGLLEAALTKVGKMMDGRRDAYDRARRLALEDGVELKDLPKVA